MQFRYFLIFLFYLFLVFSFSLHYAFPVKDSPEGCWPEVFVGVDVAYDDFAEIKRLADKLSNYTNLFIIGSTGISYNATLLYETCQYIYEKGFSFIIYSDMPPLKEWFIGFQFDYEERWGEKFLGFYAFDEGGGRQLDFTVPRPFRVYEAENYTDAGNKFVKNVTDGLNWFRQEFDSSMDYGLFTSDYALYWFDYIGGYDVVFAEFGWNYSRLLNVALSRGAATVQNKDWGIIITWTYNHPPYIESGEELYHDIIYAYENGAKYIVIFDSDEDYTHSILEEEHLDALEQFWNYIQNNPRTNNETNYRVAYVLPKGYGYGFRGPNDKIWGLWEADSLSLEISKNLGYLLKQYGTKLDIIYDDGLNSNSAKTYEKLIFWNGTIQDI